VKALAARVPVRAASRTPGDLCVPAGVEAAALDLDDPGTFAAVLEGCRALLLIPPSGPGAWQVRVTAELAAAAAGEVDHVALISGISAGHDPGSISRGLENACEKAGLNPVCLRANHFMEAYSAHYRNDVIAGRLRTYTGKGRASYIDAADVGRAGAAALLDRSQAGRVHVVTGPEALNQAQIAEILSRITGRAVKVVARSHEDNRETLRARGLPPSSIENTLHRLREIEEGRFEIVTDAVERLTGTPPTRFEDWARARAAAWA
jgi:uncharacterized protein YbjT (DUF2867 family)